MQTIRRKALGTQSLRKMGSHQDVACLGLTVGSPLVISFTILQLATLTH